MKLNKSVASYRLVVKCGLYTSSYRVKLCIVDIFQSVLMVAIVL